MTEQTSFDSEPTYPLAEQAENQVLRERLYAAQNTLVRLENERRGKVLVDPEDLRAVLVGWASAHASGTGAAWRRLYEAAGIAVEPPADPAAGDREGGDQPALWDALSDADGQ